MVRWDPGEEKRPAVVPSARCLQAGEGCFLCLARSLEFWTPLTSEHRHSGEWGRHAKEEGRGRGQTREIVGRERRGIGVESKAGKGLTGK